MGKRQTCRLCAGVSSRTTGGANFSKKSRGTCSGTCTTCGAQNRKYLPDNHSQNNNNNNNNSSSRSSVE